MHRMFQGFRLEVKDNSLCAQQDVEVAGIAGLSHLPGLAQGDCDSSVSCSFN